MQFGPYLWPNRLVRSQSSAIYMPITPSYVEVIISASINYNSI